MGVDRAPIAPWTGEIIGEMHVHGISFESLAREMGVTNRYLSMILNCHRRPKDAELKCRTALEKLKGDLPVEMF